MTDFATLPTMPSIFGRMLKRKPVAGAADAAVDTLCAEAAAAAASRDFERAVRLYDQAIALDPGRPEPHYKRGNSLKNLGLLDTAIAAYDRAIELKPDYAHAYCNRGTVQQSLGLAAAALASYDCAIALDEGDAMAHFNRALLLQDGDRWDEALAGYDRAVAIDPGYADAQYNRALARLYCGDFERGWEGYEWRWRNAQRLAIGEVRHFAAPLWLGDATLTGRRILLYGEGGLGDTLQFCRYARLCAALGATVILEVQAALVDLLGTLEGVSEIVAAGAPLPRIDYQCPLMSLPFAFKTTLATIPSSTRYIAADPARTARWQSMLGSRSRPRIGLVWSGNPNNTIDQRRSVRLADWLPHLPRKYQFFSLQKSIRPCDREALDGSSLIASFDEDSLDFDDTAAVCECMDLVISVDTSLAHLSGALGSPVWILLPFHPDWRWLRSGDTSPWYPTARLYRQRTAGDWTDVFERVAAALDRELPAA